MKAKNNPVSGKNIAGIYWKDYVTKSAETTAKLSRLNKAEANQLLRQLQRESARRIKSAKSAQRDSDLFREITEGNALKQARTLQQAQARIKANLMFIRHPLSTRKGFDDFRRKNQNAYDKVTGRHRDLSDREIYAMDDILSRVYIAAAPYGFTSSEVRITAWRVYHAQTEEEDRYEYIEVQPGVHRRVLKKAQTEERLKELILAKIQQGLDEGFGTIKTYKPTGRNMVRFK